MGNYKLKKKYIILILFFGFGFVWAHNPRIVRDQNNSIGNPIVVQEPENSQAFYAELKGKSDFYKIVSNTGFLLYLSLTVPAISGLDQDYGMLVKDNLGNTLVNINGIDSKWTKFYEKFAGDLYYQGPLFEMQVKSGTYFIQIYSVDNVGKYALAVGKLEVWPTDEIWNTFKNLPVLKSYFFEKPIITMFFNYIGLSLIVSIAIIILIILLIIRLIKFKL